MLTFLATVGAHIFFSWHFQETNRLTIRRCSRRCNFLGNEIENGKIFIRNCSAFGFKCNWVGENGKQRFLNSKTRELTSLTKPLWEKTPTVSIQLLNSFHLLEDRDSEFMMFKYLKVSISFRNSNPVVSLQIINPSWDLAPVRPLFSFFLLRGIINNFKFCFPTKKKGKSIRRKIFYEISRWKVRLFWSDVLSRTKQV